MSDLISKEQAIKAMQESEFGFTFEVDVAIEAVKALPTVEPERKTGKWIGDCCSCCGVSKYNYIKMVDDECGPFGTWNFCPNCGADMRGEE